MNRYLNSLNPWKKKLIGKIDKRVTHAWWVHIRHSWTKSSLNVISRLSFAPLTNELTHEVDGNFELVLGRAHWVHRTYIIIYRVYIICKKYGRFYFLCHRDRSRSPQVRRSMVRPLIITKPLSINKIQHLLYKIQCLLFPLVEKCLIARLLAGV